jgi:oligosaccharide repeat unit polymerase
MSESRRNRVLNNIASPYGLAAISYAFFLFACLIPPSIYTRYMHEPDLMFLDPATILFYSLCVASFVAGVCLVGWLFPAVPFPECSVTTRYSPTIFLLTPLLLGIVLTAASTWHLVASNPDIILWILTQQGGNLKGANAPEVDSTFTLAPLLLVGSIWLVFWRTFDLRLRGWRRWLVTLVLFFAVLMVMAVATLTLSRNLLMLVVCGLAILYVVRKTASHQASFKFILGAGTVTAILVTLLFAAVSYLRGSESVDEQFYMLFGYTVASYNRLAAIVNGNLHYPFAGHGVYLSGFLSFSHLFNQIVPLGNRPGFQDVWSSEFGAVTRAGLDGAMIWSGAFGYIFSDLGWFSPLLLFGYGMIYGVVWNWIKRGRVLGVVIYPCIGFCVLFWIGTNYLFDSQTVFLYVSAALLAGYDFAFVTPIKINATVGESLA